MSVEVLKQIWPEWQIEGKPLGKGSFGVVYKAVRRDHGVESYAAIKVISIPTDPSEVDSLRSEGLDMNATRTYLQGIVDDFVSEIQLMESLKGVQNIVSVEDYKVVEKTDEIGWDIYIRMELLTSFNSYICDKNLTEEEIIKLGLDICTALEICAKRNIIHRDIKPENIFINDFGYFKLGDFGIARRLEHMSVSLSRGKGTPNYMAPEIYHGSEYDARVDICSLGLVLYRMLNGNRLPFLGDKQLYSSIERGNALKRRLDGEELPPPCNASPEMANLVLRACAFNPSDRFASATEMKQALMSISSGNYKIVTDGLNGTVRVRQAPKSAEPISTPKVNTFGNAPKKKSKVPKIIAALLVILLIGGAGVFFAPKLMDMIQSNDNSNQNEDNAQYSAYDEEQIANMITEADAMAAVDDYEGALTKIKTGLVTYPKSQALKDKEIEYTDALNAHIKQSVLDEAEKFAQAKDYISAMAVIKNAQDTYGNDADYSAAYSKYEKAQAEQMKKSVLAEAEKFAQSKDYVSAMAVIKNAQDTYGNDADYSTAYSKYEKAQVEQIKQSVLTEAEKFAQSEDYMSAMAVIKNAQDSYGNDADYQVAYNKYKDAHIDSIISQSEALAFKEDYEGALVKVQTGLVAYPDSLKLQNKASEYTKSLNAQIKEMTLAEAKSFADSGDYVSAIALIKNAQKTQGDNAEYQSALKSYSSAYKTEVIASADALAAKGDYVGALEAVGTASAVVGNDAELSEKATEYENSYIVEIMSQADELVAQGDYDGAIMLLKNAEDSIGKNDTLINKITEINNSKPVYADLTSLKLIDASYYYRLYEGLILDTYGNAYTNVGTFTYCGNHHAIYYTAGKYATLYGTIAAPDSIAGGGVAITVNIYADEKLIYTIPSITRMTKPVDIALDITGADTVKIEAVTTNVYPTGILFKLNVSTGVASTNPNYVSSLNYDEQENITDLKVIDSSHYYSVKNSTIMDTYGNAYTGVGTFTYCGNHHAMYYTAGKYTTLYGTIAAPDSIAGGGVAITVNIYADDKLLHTIPSITRTTKPIDIALDISGADTIKIEAITTNVYPTGILFRLDVS